jgi:hypothetical protein
MMLHFSPPSHVGDPNATVIEVVGVPQADMKGLTVLLLS